MKPDIALLKNVLNLPTAPFHEEHVSRFIQNFCKKIGMVCKQDSFGNLKAVYKKGSATPIALTAHMDHPGFEVVRGGKKPIVQLLGGVPDHHFARAKVVFCDNRQIIKGHILKRIDKKRRRFLASAKTETTRGAFGYFDLAGIKLEKGLIKSKAIDNLISVSILLNLLKELRNQKTRAHVICIFTRAEEVGFVGASGLVKNKFLSPTIPTVVLEASSAKAGKVEIGGGPVLRVGDRFSSFSPEIDLWLKSTAPYPFQRALLQGGRCEASFYAEKGYKVGSLAFPLGNYHNNGPKNYDYEFISLKDYKKMMEWLMTLAQNPSPKKAVQKEYAAIDKIFRKYAKRLKQIPRG
ncbi:MAG: M28 family peptidase [Deltaproteobacteria bacterium]|nr:M28 family peptidase [Deltaproteobacteria bacterium]